LGEFVERLFSEYSGG
jgi:hypothetical protein